MTEDYERDNRSKQWQNKQITLTTTTQQRFEGHVKSRGDKKYDINASLVKHIDQRNEKHRSTHFGRVVKGLRGGFRLYRPVAIYGPRGLGGIGQIGLH